MNKVLIKNIDSGIKLYSLAETSEMLGIGKSTICRWIRQGKFPVPATPYGMKIQFSLEDIEEFIRKTKAENEKIYRP